MKHSQVFVKLAKIALGLALAVVLLVFIAEKIFNATYKFPHQIDYGVTFSPKFASELKMDWKEVYLRVFDELRVRHLRIPSNWDVIEAETSRYDFSQIDFMLNEAQKREAKIVLVLGIRQPRWPECHLPEWAKGLKLRDRQQKILEFIQTVVKRYQSDQTIISWQVENEPLLEDFGQGCDKPDRNFLMKEVELVRSLDKRPIILTDSGELGWWVSSMKLSDIFGTTVYRTVYNKIFGFLKYPLLPYFYNVKSYLVRSIFAPSNQKTIIIELQAEPWSPNNDLIDTPITQQTSLFSVDKFKDNINFAKGTGFDTAYLWGVEWWYFMAKNGHPEYLDYAKTFFVNRLIR